VVNEATIDRTICRAGWSETVRPPDSVTEAEKAASMAAYGDTGPMSSYEYDHFLSVRCAIERVFSLLGLLSTCRQVAAEVIGARAGC
jgi:hypothetical protein